MHNNAQHIKQTPGWLIPSEVCARDTLMVAAQLTCSGTIRAAHLTVPMWCYGHFEHNRISKQQSHSQ